MATIRKLKINNIEYPVGNIRLEADTLKNHLIAVFDDENLAGTIITANVLDTELEGIVTLVQDYTADEEGTLTKGFSIIKDGQLFKVSISRAGGAFGDPLIEKLSTKSTIHTTWQELKDKRDAGLLTPGQQYRITDYECTTVQANTQSAGHQFDIIVTADDVNKLNENARACLHGGDTYFANSKLEAWQVWYSLDNDANRFAWADSADGKGVIYRMIDEFNNDVPYDFKNIQYQETFIGFTYKQLSQTYTFTRDASLDMMVEGYPYYGYKGDRTPGSWSSNRCWLPDNPATTGSAMYDSSGAVIGAVISYGGTITAILNENLEFYTFSKTKSASENFDVSLNGILYSCYNNTIRPYIVTQAQVLNRITFVGWYTSGSYPGLLCYSNTFGDNCYNNTFGYNCSFNTFSNGCYSNTFGYDCQSNTFGNDCRSNTFGNYCSYNAFGSGCHSNTFGNGCKYNTFGGDCSSNTFGDSCVSNTLANSCESNTFGNSYSSNTFGNGCTSNTFDGDCIYNAFGSICKNNTFGNSCKNNTFGNSCSNNNFGFSCEFNTLDGGCLYNTVGNSCHGNTFSGFCSNNNLGNYCRYNTFGYDCDYLQISDVSSTQKKYIYVENGTKGSSDANKLDLYDSAISNKTYQVTFKKSTSGKYLMLWATDTGTMTGKVKATNTTPTWSNIV